MRKYFNPAVCAVIAVASLSSCSFLDQEPTVICSETFYKSQDEVLYGLAGVYGVINSLQLYGVDYSLYLSGVDDLSWYNRSSSNQFSNFYQHDASTAEIYDTWTWLYKGINNANAFMDALGESDLDPDGRMYAEARFLRAFYHFLLAQAWGDVPLRDCSVTSYDKANLAATSQYEVLAWVAAEMEACLPDLSEGLEHTPSRVCRSVAQGLLARVCLFMAGKSVMGGDKRALYAQAREWAGTVIATGAHQLNPSYSQVFINMIGDRYDTEYHESMWEADFVGDRSSADRWSNGTIGCMIGLQSTAIDDLASLRCNYAYGMYNGSLKLWDLYWEADRTEDEVRLDEVTDVRQAWNLPPYNYAGYTGSMPIYPYGGDESMGKPRNSKDRTPYYTSGASGFVTTNEDPLVVPGNRNCGKWRRETEYEPVSSVAKAQFTQINFPILRYADVLLMYAEADLESSGSVSQEAYDCVKQVRDRAGIKTKPYEVYDAASFRQLVRTERGRELCFEALRKYDLIRWGIFTDAMKDYSRYAGDLRWSEMTTTRYALNMASFVKERHIVYPIPSIELGVNTLLRQNPLW